MYQTFLVEAPGYRVCVAYEGKIVAQGPAHLSVLQALDYMLEFTAAEFDHRRATRAWADDDARRMEGRFVQSDLEESEPISNVPTNGINVEGE